MSIVIGLETVAITKKSYKVSPTQKDSDYSLPFQLKIKLNYIYILLYLKGNLIFSPIK